MGSLTRKDALAKMAKEEEILNHMIEEMTTGATIKFPEKKTDKAVMFPESKLATAFEEELRKAGPGEVVPVPEGEDFTKIIFPEAKDDPNSQFNKADGGKSNPLLVEVDLAEALEAVNRVLDYGAEKYERAGWMKVNPERYNSAARRHRRERDKGELRDKESNLIHLAHEATNLLFQLQLFIKANPDLDYTTYNKPPRAHRGG